MSDHWEFWIDVGVTFTDCVGRTPTGELRTAKLLSSGLTKGAVEAVGDESSILDASRNFEPEDFWTGSTIRMLNSKGEATFETTVVRSFSGRLECSEFPASLAAGTHYEIDSGEEAPVLAIRKLLRLSRGKGFPKVVVKLGTTRGTNALLTRRGARTAFVTTRGFADVLLIANQDRPRLFDLDIKKPEPMFESVVEIDELGNMM